jgi:hypothetical protein
MKLQSEPDDCLAKSSYAVKANNDSSDDVRSEYFSPGSDDDRPQTAFQVKRSMADPSKSSSDVHSQKEMSPNRAKTATSSSITSVEPKSLAEPALRNMTVETETVTSIPQATIAAADRNVRTDLNGTLRVKASNETIRPKKERKKASKKAPSITSGPRTSPSVFGSIHGYDQMFSPVSQRRRSVYRNRADSVPVLPHTPSLSTRGSSSGSPVIRPVSPKYMGFRAVN